ncbi:MAG: hypothetical protein IPL79_01360 [Myxococcales bacterium]|nr:hypothetical protein [Myxococcales bacterium]
MTAAHIIYIPMVLMVGLFVGFVLGARAARNAQALAEKRQQERAARAAARRDESSPS